MTPHLPQFAVAIARWALALALAGALCRWSPAQGVDGPPPGAAEIGGQAPAVVENRYGFPVWHADYPVTLELPTPNPAPTYQRTRRQALEQVAAHLQGNTRREVWLAAVEFFRRAPEDAVPVLIAAMDRAFGNPGLKDVVRNVLEAMGRVGGEDFDDSLRRAFEHPDPNVRQAAYGALAKAGSLDTVRHAAAAFLGGMDGRAKRAWLTSVRLHLPPAEAAALFGHLLVPEVPPAIRDMVIDRALELPPAIAAPLLAPQWDDARGPFRATLAVLLHDAGNTNGTLWLHNQLVGDDPAAAVVALSKLKGHELGPLREDVLRLSTSPRPDIRLSVADCLVGVDGDDVGKVLELFAGTEELPETKSIALRELTRRGRTDAVTQVLEELESATGTRLHLLLRLLTASGDPRAVAVLRARFAATPAGDGREFLQGLALSRAPGAAAALFELFAAPDRAVSRPSSRGEQLSTLDYIPVLLPNLHGEEDALLALWSKLPADDYGRRARYLNALAAIAVDREDPAVRGPIVELLRSVLFDREALPQLRVQALNRLERHFLTLEDVLRMRRLQEPGNDTESAPMRRLWKDFLLEFF